MKIGLISPIYVLNRSYQENVWAEQLAKAGHQVRVFCGGRRQHGPALVAASTGNYEVQTIRTRVLPRSVFLPRGIAAEVRAFDPDLLVVIGDKFFARALAKDESLRQVPMISTFSENLGMHEFDWRRAGISMGARLHALGFALLRGAPIRAVCRRSEVIVGNTLHARDIILRLFSDSRERETIARKIIEQPLGFSPDHYRYDPALRRRVRDELQIGSDEIVIITTSRFDPEKASSIRLVINAAEKVMQEVEGVRLLVAGFSDTATSSELREVVRRSPSADQIIVHTFADRKRMNELFNASDIVAYNLATISCQEALGTGLFACFADAGTMHHLITSDDQGVLFTPFDASDLALKLSDAVERFRPLSMADREGYRRRLVQASRWLGYDRIIASILDRVDTARRPGTPAV